MLTVLAGAYPVVVVDAGRWSPGSPADELLTQCGMVLLVARPVLEQVRQCEALVGPLGRLVGDVRLLLVEGRGGWPAAEVGATLGLPAAGVLPADEQGAGVLAGRLVPRNGWRARGLSSWVRLPLPRACHSLARGLAPATTGAVAADEAMTPVTPAVPEVAVADGASEDGPRSGGASTPAAGLADEAPVPAGNTSRHATGGQVV